MVVRKHVVIDMDRFITLPHAEFDGSAALNCSSNELRRGDHDGLQYTLISQPGYNRLGH